MNTELDDVATITGVVSLSPNVRPGFTQIDFSGKGFGFVVVPDESAINVRKGDRIGITRDQSFVFPLERLSTQQP